MYTNKLGFYWKARHISAEDKKLLNNKMVLNYYGFWLNKICHIYYYYFLYKKDFFKTKSELKFWGTLVSVTAVLIFSSYNIDYLLNRNLAFYIEDLHFKYGAEIDDLRKEFQKDKSHKQIIRNQKLGDIKMLGKRFDGFEELDDEI